MEIANRFNEYFATIESKLSEQIPTTGEAYTSYMKDSYVNSFAFYPVDAIEIVNILNNFRDKNSCGFDSIPLDIIKKTVKPIAQILSDLVNQSFSSGYFPDELKIAKITPIFKNGAPNIFTNYRPLFILPSFSKIV